MPYLSLNVMKEYKELEGQPIKDSEGNLIEIGTALQTIKFTLDDVGGKIKSEAGVMLWVSRLPRRDYVIKCRVQNQWGIMSS